MTEASTAGDVPVQPDLPEHQEPTQEPVGEPARSTRDDAGTAEQPELDLGVVPTGDPRVDDALGALDALPDRPVDEHPEVFEAVHRGLHEVLSDVSEPSG